MRIETTILKNLLHDEDYARKVVPHLREEYFQDKIERAASKLELVQVRRYTEGMNSNLDGINWAKHFNN